MKAAGGAGRRWRSATPIRPASRRILLPLWLSISLLLLLPVSCVKIPESGSRHRVLFYAAATSLLPGSPLDSRSLEEHLTRLGYHSVANEVVTPGQYRISHDSAEIFLRPFHYPGRLFAGGRVRLRLSAEGIRRVELIDSLRTEDLRLEPERIAGFQGETGALLAPLRLEEAPPLLVRALVAVEDRRFYHHPGVDPIGAARAVWINLRHKEASQGGSTLTQQLARSLYLRNDKTVMRKLREAVIALELEMRYSKKEILEAYLNAVYWGTWGSMEIRGAREASRYYLGCDLDKADTAGIALLVGIIPAPNAYSPYNNPAKAKQRRNLVLHELAQRKILTEEEAEKAAARPLPVRRAPLRPAEASYFLEAARAEVERRAPKGILDQPGTIVFTTLDPVDQSAAVTAVRAGLTDLEKAHRRLRRKKDPLEAAVVSIDPENGEVRALVGGRDFLEYPFNRAVDAERQPGSLFKPFVYLTAFEHPRRKDGSFWTPATIIDDEPIEIPVGRKTWTPENYDREYRGEVTARTALEQSLNVPTAQVAYEVGLRRVVNTARDLGIKSPLSAVPSLALGTSEVNLLEITGAYAGLSAGGTAHPPTCLRAVVAPKGEVVPLTALEDPPGAEAEACYLVTSLLQGVIEEGTGRNARGLGVRGAVAGKTGTTDDYRDAWFVGYTPRRSIGVWVGFDHRDPVGLSGASAALPIWAMAMSLSEGSHGDGSFVRPDGVITVAIDPESGLLATSDCPTWRDEIFLAGTEPTERCDRHRRSFLDRLGRFFGW
jgi:penicillin-binding protein 1B